MTRLHYLRRMTLAILVGSMPMPATTLERLSINDMSDQSMIIAVASVASANAEFKDGTVSTHYRLNVTEFWKGSAGNQIDVYVPGGTAGGVRQLVPGAPALTAGAEYVVFLWIGRSGRPQIIGLSQGLFSVTTDASGATRYAERRGASETMIDPATGRPVTDDTVRMSTSELRALVKKRLGTN